MERLLLAIDVAATPGKLLMRGPMLEVDIESEDVSEAWPPPIEPIRFAGERPMLLPMLLPLPMELRDAHLTVSNTFL